MKSFLALVALAASANAFGSFQMPGKKAAAKAPPTTDVSVNFYSWLCDGF